MRRHRRFPRAISPTPREDSVSTGWPSTPRWRLRRPLPWLRLRSLTSPRHRPRRARTWQSRTLQQWTLQSLTRSRLRSSAARPPLTSVSCCPPCAMVSPEATDTWLTRCCRRPIRSLGSLLLQPQSQRSSSLAEGQQRAYASGSLCAGTIGHVAHGKSTVVKAISGVHVRRSHV